MLHYFEKEYVSAQAAIRRVGVQCDKCGCAYSYELARIGTGRAVAPYYIGKSAAARSAQKAVAT